MGHIVIDPVTRIEGHLKVEAVVEKGVVKEARSSGMLFRGIETILRGRDPRDAQYYTQRICGVCPTSHSMAATLNLDSAFGIADKIPDNGRIIRNLILGAAHVSDHILHFYHLAALDYVDIGAVAGYEGNDPALLSVKKFALEGDPVPFLPRYKGDYRLSKEQNLAALSHYLQALEMRRKGHEMLAIFGGRIPHNNAIVPGGVSEVPTVDKITSFLWMLNELRDFINSVYIPDLVMVAKAYKDYCEIGKGCGHLLSYGNYDLDGKVADYSKRKRLLASGTVDNSLRLEPLDMNKVTEDVMHSWYQDVPPSRPFEENAPQPQIDKKGAYSFIKSPRYGGQVYEVGPLARLAVTYAGGDPTAKTLVDGALSTLKASPTALFSVAGRHLARALCCKIIADAMPAWLLQLKVGEPAYLPYTIPDEAKGMGLVDGARGALAHYIEIKGKKIANYQCVVPSTWNLCPRDKDGNPGPVEQALEGARVKDEANPIELVRIVRSFDPCIACAVHVVTPKGNIRGKYIVS